MSYVTQLHQAVDKRVLNSEEILKCLEQDGFSVDIQDMYDRTPLLLLLENENCSADIVKLLLDYGASVKEKDGLSPIPLFVLLKNKNCSTEIVQILIDFGASVKKENRFGETPLSVFLQKGNCSTDILKLLLANGASVNKTDMNGGTPLLNLLQNKNCTAECVKLLLEYKADTNIGNVLTTALRNSREEEVLEALLENCVKTNILRLYRSPLCYALSNGYSKGVIEMLLDNGCSSKACEYHGCVLHCAVAPPRSRLKRDVLDLLLERGADVKRVNKHGQSILCLALAGGANAEDIDLLLLIGAPVNACTKHESLLHCATSTSSIRLSADLVKLLHNACIQSDSGACLDKVDGDGNTPLQCALLNTKYKTGAIKCLLGLKCLDVNKVKNENNDTLLHSAVCNRQCKLSALKLLIDRGAQVDQVNKDGCIPLHLAVSYMFCEPTIVSFLLKNGSPVNIEDNFRQTPLKSALKVGHNSNMLKILLVAGAEIGVNKKWKGHFLLESVLKKYDKEGRRKEGRDRFKMMVKYSFIEYPPFEIEYSIRRHVERESFSDFAGECFLELQKMESIQIGHGRTLREFVTGCSASRMGAADFKANEYDFNRLLKILTDNLFPLYFDIIAAKVGRDSMKTKLEEVSVYTVKSLGSQYWKDKVFMNFESICEIAQFSSDEDLLRLILAFYNSNTHTGQGSLKKEKRLCDEMHCEQSTEINKCTKLDH